MQIKKLDLEKRNSFGTLDWLAHLNEPSGAKLIEGKINELVDAVNELQEQYDNVCIWVGEQKLKTPAQNIPEPIKLYVCADGSMYDNEDVAKSHAASIFNPLPAGTTTTDQVYLEQDPYAEQRKWIGKLCKFRDKYQDEVWEYGTLEDVENVDSAIDSAFRSSDGYWYDICEPVKPDDDIIYKGE